MRTHEEIAEAATALLTALTETEGVVRLVAAEAGAAADALRMPRIRLDLAVRPRPGEPAADTAQLVDAITKGARAADDVRERFRKIAAAVGSRQPPAGSRPA